MHAGSQTSHRGNVAKGKDPVAVSQLEVLGMLAAVDRSLFGYLLSPLFAYSPPLPICDFLMSMLSVVAPCLSTPMLIHQLRGVIYDDSNSVTISDLATNL